MHLSLPATLFGVSSTAVAMCAAGVAVLLIGAFAARREIAEARGLERIAALGKLCFGIPLGVFGALHLFAVRLVVDIVPAYVPWRSFWAYAVGCALIVAAVSIVTGIGTRWSGLLFGIMMVLFVAMIHLPGALGRPHDRILWTIVFRELSFGGAGWMLAGSAMGGRRRGSGALIAVGRALVTAALVVFGVEHFLHPRGLPGVPLQREMPAWVPGGVLIDFMTGAGLLAAAGSVLLEMKTRTVAAGLGAWILLTLLAIYLPVMISALSEPGIAAQVEGINYLADTLLFAGVVLALAKASPRAAAFE